MLSYRSEIKNRQKIKANKIVLSKQEYAVLRKEVMRKNSAQKGKIKSTNYAFTSNHFYVYSTNGGDSFKPIKQFDVEKDRDKINVWLASLGE